MIFTLRVANATATVYYVYNDIHNATRIIYHYIGMRII